ncbi:type II secretion system protein [Deinococcus kurensis]|uniref:type II secretion system protein n=1 Tax=Deinococcus kurensis TaxID=2662757 RepID=UPI0012D33A8A|nr:type II secretion system protein [Deinococcus kurensis]
MKQGFTLIEVLIVIAIVGIVAAVLIPVATSGVGCSNPWRVDTEDRAYFVAQEPVWDGPVLRAGNQTFSGDIAVTQVCEVDDD